MRALDIAKRPQLITKLLQLPLFVSVVMLLGSCDGKASGGGGGGLEQPTTINLYPVAATQEESARLFVLVIGVGFLPVRLPLAFDTGSSGITLNALTIFPETMVTENGFNFPVGQTSLTYQGITVSNQQGTRSYTGRTEYGNVGFATITFGDENGSLTTKQMPIFLYYAETITGTSYLAAPEQQQGWFGVNAQPDVIDIPGSIEPQGGYPACTLDTTGTCFVGSVFEMLAYSNTVSPGFMLTPARLNVCDISIAGDCAPAGILTVGLTSALEAAFSVAPLTCYSEGGSYSGPLSIEGYSACAATFPATVEATPSTPGSATASFPTTVLFDTGTPSVVINVPEGVNFPASASQADSIDITVVPSAFVYQLSPTTGLNSVAISSNSSGRIVAGLPYFLQHSFFIDFATHGEGWK